jgi:hypothetical protein
MSMTKGGASNAVDRFAVDAPIGGQTHVVVSFVGPNEAQANRNVLVLSRYIREPALALAKNLLLLAETVPDDTGIIGTISVNNAWMFHEGSMQDEFRIFCAQQDVNASLAEENGGKSSMHGIKVRGLYDTQDAATARSKEVRKKDKASNIWIAPVGAWLPLAETMDAAAGKQDESSVNLLVQHYVEAQRAKKASYETSLTLRKGGRVLEEMKAQIDEPYVLPPASPPDGIDHLDTDAPIPGQSFAVISVGFPEVSKSRRDKFFFAKFRHAACATMLDLIQTLSAKYMAKEVDVQGLERIMIEHKLLLKGDDEHFDEFFRTQAEIRADFTSQTSLHAFKIRGVCGSQADAETLVRSLRLSDTDHNCWVGAVGAWLPLSETMDASAVDEEFPDNEMNALMKSYRESQNKQMQEKALASGSGR